MSLPLAVAAIHPPRSYMCMPQPSATDDTKSGQGGSAPKASADHRQMESLDANGDGTVSVSELVDGLRKAVESIPSYIERCTQSMLRSESNS